MSKNHSEVGLALVAWKVFRATRSVGLQAEPAKKRKNDRTVNKFVVPTEACRLFNTLWLLWS